MRDNNNEPDKLSGRKRKGVQSNHDEYIIPQSMEPWSGEPLYLLVARWCLQQNRWINRNDIAVAFHLTERRASFQLSYISRKKARVVCRTRYNTSHAKGGGSRNEIRVDRILPPSPGGRGSSPQYQQSNTVKIPGAVSSRVGSGMTGHGRLWEQLLGKVRKIK
ncbi:CaiF/GrlA family transcriptional regulator [Salmonella enterica subsp. enterica serovar Infantis]|nr:CaiF/GrlA family transcriptional regulator [Salmonella enterica subsp. enterica serovar Infantis]